jgi:hypothetical protein
MGLASARDFNSLQNFAGLIIVYTGILPVCQDEQGLAAVLAHGKFFRITSPLLLLQTHFIARNWTRRSAFVRSYLAHGLMPIAVQSHATLPNAYPHKLCSLHS